MPASNGRTEASAVSRKLDPIVSQLEAMESYFESMQQLVDDEILTQEESDEVVDAYKQGIQSQVDRIQVDENALSDEIAIAGVIETDDKAEGIVPLAINGSAVISPLPSVIAAEKVTLLSDQPTLEAEVVSKLDQINNVVG